MDKEAMHALLTSSISPSRYRHTLGVIESAKALGKIYGADDEKIEIAALLHDCAKSMSEEEMIRSAVEEGFPPDEFELSAPPVLHAPAGAAIAKRVYAVTDEEVLRAIRSHTIGCVSPTKLDAILFVADFIEPGRKPFDGLTEARALSKTDLLGAMKMCARLSGEYVVSCGGRIHPVTLKMINDTEDLI